MKKKKKTVFTGTLKIPFLIKEITFRGFGFSIIDKGVNKLVELAHLLQLHC